MRYCFFYLLALMFLGCGSNYYGFHGYPKDFKFSDFFDSLDTLISQPVEIVKFNEGAYLFQLCLKRKEVEGVDVATWYTGDCNGNGSYKEESYFIFLDDCRVYYFSNWDEKEKQLDNLICNGANNGTSDSQPSPREFEVVLSERKKVVNDMRGYYKIIEEKEFVNRRDTTELKIVMVLEKAGKKTRIRFHEEPRRIDFAAFAFHVQLDENGNTIEALDLEKALIKTHRNAIGSNKRLAIRPEKVFNMESDIVFQLDTGLEVSLLAEHHNQKLTIDKINYFDQLDSVAYYFQDVQIFHEIPSDSMMVRTW